MAEGVATPATRSTALPADSELLTHLESGVATIFASMIGDCARLARIEGGAPPEPAEARGDSALQPGSTGEAPQRSGREAVVEFRGALDGRVALRAGGGCATAIARGLLMAPEGEPLAPEEIDDALKECANMITGWLKSQALDPIGEFTISVPFLERSGRAALGPPAGSLVYRTGGGEFCVELWRRTPSAQAA